MILSTCDVTERENGIITFFSNFAASLTLFLLGNCSLLV